MLMRGLWQFANAGPVPPGVAVLKRVASPQGVDDRRKSSCRGSLRARVGWSVTPSDRRTMKPAPAATSRRRTGASASLEPPQQTVSLVQGGQLRVISHAAVNPQRAREAAENIRRIGSLHKPSKRRGAVASVRGLRDGGD
jgi:hypothetical protein